MEKKRLLIFIFLLAFVLRFYQLGSNPSSLDWDEASLGYNAFSLLKTGKDEYGQFLPLSIRSFNDYKPPLYTYLSIIPIWLFGLNEFSTRFISALCGSLSIIAGYFLIKELFPRKSPSFYLLFTFFFAVSPWHLQFSRVAFEANLALFFFILGTWLFVKHFSTSGVRQLADPVYLYLSFISFGLSCYAYHSPRLIIPIFLFGLIFVYRREIIRKIVPFLVGIFILSLMLFPLVRQFRSVTGMRLSSVTVLNPDERLGESIKAIEFDQKRGDFLGRLMHNRRIVYGRELLAGYLDHFNFDFLFLTGDAPGRHHAAGMGMLYIWDLPFVILGVVYLLKRSPSCEVLRARCSLVPGEDDSSDFVPTESRLRPTQSEVGREGILVTFWWFLIAPIASSLTTGTPHAVRALFYLPTYQIFSAFGVMEALRFFKKPYNHFGNGPDQIGDSSEVKLLCKPSPLRSLLSASWRIQSPRGSRIKSGMTIWIVTFSFFIINFFYYLHMYWIHTPYEEAFAWQYGYKQVVEQVRSLEKNFDKVIVTYQYDQPYIYFLFYNQVDPSWYQQNWGEGEIKRAERKFGKYEFHNIDWDKDSKLKNVILVGAPGEIPDSASGVIKDINFPDGTFAFRIVGL